jgi:hypothetical protein
MVTEIECGKCGVYVYVGMEEGRLVLVRGCHHYTLDEDLEYHREEIMEAIA